jgi:hypothetical protein
MSELPPLNGGTIADIAGTRCDRRHGGTEGWWKVVVGAND